MSRTLPDYNQLMRFTINDVCCWLGENRFGEFVRMFREHGVDGNRFITLTDLDLTKMSCPMNKRKDLLRLIKDLPKPDASRVKNVVQPRTPAAPERDYNAHRGRPPAPIPTSSHTQQNGNDDYYDDDSGSGPEDDYEWNKSDFSEVSSEEDQDYENDIDKLPPAPQRPKPATPDEESDNPSDYEEPETTPGPPPSIPSRGAPTAPRNTGPVPVNRRPVPQIPPPEEDQPVYDAPEEQEQKTAPAVKKPGGRRQLPIPGEQSKPTRGGAPMPQRTISEPESPAPPPPRNKSKPIMNRVPEQTAPVQPPPPRGGRRVQPPPEPEQEIYEEPDESPAQPSPLSSRPTPPPPRSQPPVIEQEEFYEDPDNTTSEPVEQEEFYEDPDNQTSNTKPEPIEQETYDEADSNMPLHSVRNSALPPVPNERPFMPTLPVVEQEMYEETDSAPPSQPPPLRNRVLPPAPKAASHPPRPGKKAIPVQEETYEVTDNTDGPTEHYMEMQPTQEVKKSTPNKTAERTMPPRPGGRNRPMPDIPVSEPPKPERKADSLDDQPWYHGDIERPAADGKLTANGTNGCYLIRRSKKGGETKPYTLAIFYSGQVFNLNIRKKPSKKYALGNAKPDEQEFEDLFKVVEFFQSHRLILAKGQTRLKTPCPK